MPFLILSLVIQLSLVVHVIKTGRNMSWVFIVLFFPLIGTLAYLIVELLPQWSNSRTGVTARRRLRRLANPYGTFKAASRNFEVADTAQNAIRLAAEYLEKQQYQQAAQLYQRALRGVHADDPVLLLGLAHARFGLADATGATQALDLLKEKHPDHTSPEGHLLYAKAKEQLGDLQAAAHEYEALTGYYSGPEPTCRLAAIYKAQGRTSEARALFQKVVSASRIAGRHYNILHKNWVAMAQREL